MYTCLPVKSDDARIHNSNVTVIMRNAVVQCNCLVLSWNNYITIKPRWESFHLNKNSFRCYQTTFFETYLNYVSRRAFGDSSEINGLSVLRNSEDTFPHTRRLFLAKSNSIAFHTAWWVVAKPDLEVFLKLKKILFIIWK